MSSPAVSILLPSYNYAQYLRDAVDSILAQTYTQWELLIIDDGSKDTSVAIAREYAARDERIRVFQHPDGGNHGLAATLHYGLKKARHPIIAFLESDDVWEPESLEIRLPHLATPGTALVFNAPRLLVESERDLNYYEGILATQKTVIARRSPPRIATHELVATNLITGFSCVLTYRNLLLRCDFSSPSPPLLDKWLWQQLSLCGTCRFVSEALTTWRLHRQSYIAMYHSNAAEKTAWRQKTHALLINAPKHGLGLWLACHAPALHSFAVRFWLKFCSQGLSGIFRAFRDRL